MAELFDLIDSVMEFFSHRDSRFSWIVSESVVANKRIIELPPRI